MYCACEFVCVCECEFVCVCECGCVFLYVNLSNYFNLGIRTQVIEVLRTYGSCALQHTVMGCVHCSTHLWVVCTTAHTYGSCALQHTLMGRMHYSTHLWVVCTTAHTHGSCALQQKQHRLCLAACSRRQHRPYLYQMQQE